MLRWRRYRRLAARRDGCVFRHSRSDARAQIPLCRLPRDVRHKSATNPWRSFQPRFHYADFPGPGKFRGSRSNGIWAKGDVTGLSQTSRGCRHSGIWALVCMSFPASAADVRIYASAPRRGARGIMFLNCSSVRVCLYRTLTTRCLENFQTNFPQTWCISVRRWTLHILGSKWSWLKVTVGIGVASNL